MTPIFKNHDVSLDGVGEFMQNYAKGHSIKDVPRCLLKGSYFGKKNRTFYVTIKMVLRTRTCRYLSLLVFTQSSNIYLMLPSIVL